MKTRQMTVIWNSTHWLPEKVTEIWNLFIIDFKVDAEESHELSSHEGEDSSMFLKEQLKLFMVRITMF